MSKPKVMVALRDAESVESLIGLACQMAQGMGGEVIALHVSEIPQPTPLDADDEILDRPGKELLCFARQVALNTYSMPIATRLVRARLAGDAIVEDAKEQGAELLVLGYHHPHTFGEVVLGSVVRYVARHAPCRVIVQIPSLDGHGRR